MITNLFYLWKNNRWVLMIVGCILILFILSFFNRQGTSDYDGKNLLSLFRRDENEGFSNDRFSPPFIRDNFFSNDGYIPTSLQGRNDINDYNLKHKMKVQEQIYEFVEEGSARKGENECRRALEKIFQKKFIKSRIPELLNPVTGTFLELDCYNQELNLGLEYQGGQHYQYNKFFHKNKEAFKNQQYRDYIKKKLCEEHNIKLIVVPNTVKINDIYNFILSQVRKMKFH